MKTTPQNGIVVGEVTSLEDPQNIGRVKVRFPHLGDEESHWARLVTLMAGADRGTRFLPEVGDEVLVCFEQGDPRRPYVMGSLWSTIDTPPVDDGDTAANNWRYIRSRSGHIIRLDDTQGAEKIEFIDRDESHRIVIDTSGDRIEITCDSGDVLVRADSGKVEVSASEVNVTASGNMKLEASGSMTIKGATVDIN